MKRIVLALLGCVMLAATGCCGSMCGGCNSCCGTGMGSGCGMFSGMHNHQGCGMFSGGCNNCQPACDYSLPTYDGSYGAPVNYGPTGMGGQPGCNCNGGQPTTMNAPNHAPGMVMSGVPYQGQIVPGQVMQEQPYQGQMISLDGMPQGGGWSASMNAAPQTPVPAAPQILQTQSYEMIPQASLPQL